MLPSHRFAAGEVIVKTGKGNVMDKRNLVTLLATSATIVFAATQAYAQATRTWVSGTGNDADPCSRTAPCKTFSGAQTKTATGGEINCLDPGGYGAVSITKSLTIDCTGTLGGSLASATTGISVNDGAGATPGTANVVLRGIDINGTGTILGTNGIRFIRGASLTVEQVRIQNFSTAGINIDPAAGNARVIVIDSTILGSTAASERGVRILPSGSATANVSLQNVVISGHFRGIDLVGTSTTGTIAVTMTGGQVFGNSDTGINVDTDASAANAVLQEVAIVNNGNGFVTNGAGAQGRIGSSNVTGNTLAFAANGGSIIRSFKNNQVDLNTNNAIPRPEVVLE